MNDASSPFRSVLAMAALALAPVLAGCSVAAAQTAETAEATEPTAREQGGRQCFYPRQVSGFRNIKDEETRVLVDVRAGETFELQLERRCPELRFARGITFDQRGVGRVCDGLEVDLIVPDPNLGPQRCTVTAIRRLSAEEPGARAGSRN